MDAKFISINTKAGFEKNKSSIPQKSITFIKETAEIYADGNIYSSMSPVTETVTLTPGVTAKLGVFNGQTLNVLLNDEEQYSGSTDVSRIDPAQKCQTFYQSVDARIGFIYGNKTHGTYNIVIRAQENITIEVPRSENYIVAKYKFELTKNATLVLKMHIIDDSIVVSYDEYQGYEEIEDIVTLQNKTELPYSGGMITVSVNKIKTRVYDDGSIVELSNQVLGANSVVVTSYNYGLEDWQKTAVVNVGGEDITINYTQYAPHILAKYTITDDKYLVNNTDEIYKIVANGVDLGTNSEVAEPGEYTARIYLKNGTISATYNFELMFASTPGLKSIDLSQISYLDTFITSVNQMFANAENLAEINLGDLTFANCTDMTGLFGGTAITSIDVSKFNTSKCKYMGMMFAYTNLETLDLTSFDFSNVEDYTAMFARSLKLRELKAYSGIAGLETQMLFAGIETDGILYTDNWDNIFATYAPSTWTIKAPSKITIEVKSGASNLFYNGQAYDDISSYITRMTVNGTDVSISNAPNLPNDSNAVVVYFDEFDKSITLKNLFYNCTYITSIDLSKFNTSKATDMSYMFFGCTALTSLDLSNINTSNTTQMISMFYNCKLLTELDLSSFDTSNVTIMKNMFYYCYALISLNVSSFNTSNVVDMNGMFCYCTALTSLDTSNFNTSKVTNMGEMFRYCSSLTSLDISNFNTSKVTNMGEMFRYCSSLTSLDISNFNTSKVTNMNLMFSYCQSLTSLDVSHFDASKATDIANMFYFCKKLTSLDLSNFDTRNATKMYQLFYHCESLTSLNLSNFNTSKATNLQSMFAGCSALTSINLSSFNTSKVTQMDYMFNNCNALKSIDLSSFDVSNATTLSNMFQYCYALAEVKLFGSNLNAAASYSNFISTNISTGDVYISYKYIETQEPILEKFPTTWTVHYTYDIKTATSITALESPTVSCRTTSVSMKFQLTGTTSDGDTVSYPVTGTLTIPENLTDQEVTHTVTYTYMGVSCTATIIQGAYAGQYYDVNLNDNWQLSTRIANPDSSLYDGVYESYNNYNVHNLGAFMYINIFGYDSFDLYIRSYAESSWDYVMVSQLDTDITNSTSSSSSAVKAHTCSNQQSGTAISNYTKVSYTGIDPNTEHKITIVYRKDGSGNSYDDRGYVLIPKQ